MGFVAGFVGQWTYKNLYPVLKEMIRDYLVDEETILDVGRNLPKGHVTFYSQKKGGYVTLDTIDRNIRRASNRQFLTEKEEMKILHIFRRVEGMDVNKAKNYIESRGYTLRNVNNLWNNNQYDATAIYARISDTNEIPYIVKELLHIGGIPQIPKKKKISEKEILKNEEVSQKE